MKKNRSLLLSFLGAGVVAAGATTLHITDYRQAPEVAIPLPPVSDSLTVSTNKFDNAKLLAAKAFIRDYEDQNWTQLRTDTSGVVTGKAASGEALLNTYTTRLNAARYTKGKLRIKATAMAEVRVNGETVINKTTADSTATAAEGDLEMRPATEYIVQVNMLALPDDKSKPEFSLEFEPAEGFEQIEISNAGRMKRKFEIEDISLGQRVTATEFSSDGKYLLLYFKEMFDANNTRFWTEVRETESNKTIHSSFGNNLQWMPKGHRVYSCEKNDGDYNVYVTDINTLKTELFASRVPVNNFIVAPDESYLIYMTPVEGQKEEGVMRRVKNPDDRMPGNRDHVYLTKYDIKSRTSTPLTYGGLSTNMCDISRDSKKLLYVTTRETPSEYPFYSTDVIQLDVATLKTDTLIRGEHAFNNAIYSPDAKQLFVIGGPGSLDSIGMNCGPHPIPNDFDGQGFIFNIADRKAKAMTRDFNPAIVGEPIWNAGDGKIYFRAEDKFYVPVFCLDPASGKISKVDTGLDNVGTFSLPQNSGHWLSAVGSSYDYAGRTELVDLKTGKNRMIADPLTARLGNVEFGKTSTWTFTASDGTEIDGMMCLPPGFDPSRKYPLIVYYYGGTSPSDASMHHPYTPQLFASRDYVVYVVNPSGTTGYGQEFSARHVNAWGKRTADEIIEGTKEFCRQHPFVDDKKIGCLGASYGGFMTQLLQTKTDIFAAAVSHAGISNVTSYWGEGFWGYSYNAVAAAKSYPWTDPELYTQQGSLFNADKIHTPLLLLHGTVDTNVPIGESIQLFNALKVLGRTVEFITVEDQDHVITDYNKRKLWQNTIMAWFAKWLQDDPQWWDSMYGD